MEVISTLNAYRNIFIQNLEELKCELKSFFAADFLKQASSIQEVGDIIQELELNQSPAEVTKFLHLMLTTPGTSSCERLFSSLTRINNYMKYSQSEE